MILTLSSKSTFWTSSEMPAKTVYVVCWWRFRPWEAWSTLRARRQLRRGLVLGKLPLDRLRELWSRVLPRWPELCVVKMLLFPSSLSEIMIVVGVGVEAGPGTDNPRKFESDADCWDCGDTVHGWGCGGTVDCWVRSGTVGVDWYGDGGSAGFIKVCEPDHAHLTMFWLRMSIQMAWGSISSGMTKVPSLAAFWDDVSQPAAKIARVQLLSN